MYTQGHIILDICFSSHLEIFVVSHLYIWDVRNEYVTSSENWYSASTVLKLWFIYSGFLRSPRRSLEFITHKHVFTRFFFSTLNQVICVYNIFNNTNFHFEIRPLQWSAQAAVSTCQQRRHNVMPMSILS